MSGDGATVAMMQSIEGVDDVRERERVNEDEELYNKRRRRKEGDVEKEEIYIYRE